MVMKLEEHDIPQIADNEVLIKVKAVGICGSDISYYYGHSPLDTPNGKGPMYLGHEASGVVAEVGSIPRSLGLFKEGDRVALNPVQQCNACPACMRGEFNQLAVSAAAGRRPCGIPFALPAGALAENTPEAAVTSVSSSASRRVNAPSVFTKASPFVSSIEKPSSPMRTTASVFWFRLTAPAGSASSTEEPLSVSMMSPSRSFVPSSRE